MGSSQPDGLVTLLVRMCQRLLEIFEGVDKILREREPHDGIGLYQFCVLEKLGAAVWGSAHCLGPYVESVFSKGTNFCGMSVGWEN